MNIVSYPLRYARLRTENGKLLWTRDPTFVVILGVLLALPFVLGEGVFFGAGGLLDRVGTFNSVLTGFYIAALVGVASLSSTVGDLDEYLEQGKVFGPDGELTRRQYVCSLFGYLAFLSLFLSIAAIFAVTIAQPLDQLALGRFKSWIIRMSGVQRETAGLLLSYGRAALVLSFTMLVSHLIATTCHGLYYYIEKIYAKKTTLSQKPPAE